MSYKGSPLREAFFVLTQYADSFEKGNIRIPVPVELIAELLCGLSIERKELPREVPGELYYADRKICVRSFDPLPRQRFTIAHEIGHVHLHAPKTAVQCSLTTRQAEVEANQFAVGLLMPINFVFMEIADELHRRDLNDYPLKREQFQSLIQHLAGTFQVSKTAMGLLLDRKFKYLFATPRTYDTEDL